MIGSRNRKAETVEDRGMPSPAPLNEALDDFRRLEELRRLPTGDSHRVREQPVLVSRFYDVVTRFYEYAWGSTFHFSPRRPGESLAASQRRHDEAVGSILRLAPGMEVADIGCGVGGPLVNIAKATGARVTGVNFNAHQIGRGRQRVRRAGLANSCGFLYADYMNAPLADGVFDAMYSFEATCHAPNKTMLFRELYRLLKPGGEAAFVEWCLTDAFDRADARHVDIRERIERTNAVPDLPTAREQVDAIESAGFEILEALDQQVAYGNPATPWYMALQGRDLSLSSLARIPAGRSLTAKVTAALEWLRIAPKGTAEAAAFLNVAADALVEGGELGIFTPSYLVHARRPETVVVPRD